MIWDFASEMSFEGTASHFTRCVPRSRRLRASESPSKDISQAKSRNLVCPKLFFYFKGDALFVGFNRVDDERI
jgi:hypothetical protein